MFSKDNLPCVFSIIYIGGVVLSLIGVSTMTAHDWCYVQNGMILLVHLLLATLFILLPKYINTLSNTHFFRFFIAVVSCVGLLYLALFGGMVWLTTEMTYYYLICGLMIWYMIGISVFVWRLQA